MSSDLLIEARNVHKTFISPTDSSARLMRALFGDRIKTNDSPVLRGVSVSVSRGERVGILGRNGAGKTTLLSILGGVSKPTKGEVKRSGKAAVLLGTSGAFNQELTGRENAALYVRLQGYQGEDASRRVDVIEEFAELDRYFDMPIRTYSSGMLSRLSFGCAAHVEADLIILDEALAVGDAEFRMKCYSVMEQRAANGQSYILVSHNPNIIANFCTRGIVMEKGRILFDGAPREATSHYKQHVIDARKERVSAKLEEAVLDDGDSSIPDAGTGQISNIRVSFQTQEDGQRIGVISMDLIAHRPLRSPVAAITVKNHQGIPITGFRTGRELAALAPMAAGDTVSLRAPFLDVLRGGEYWLRCFFAETLDDGSDAPISFLDNVARFKIDRPSGGGLVNLYATADATGPGLGDAGTLASAGAAQDKH